MYSKITKNYVFRFLKTCKWPFGMIGLMNKSVLNKEWLGFGYENGQILIIWPRKTSKLFKQMYLLCVGNSGVE